MTARKSASHLEVPLTPTVNTHATSKKYVDEKVAEVLVGNVTIDSVDGLTDALNSKMDKSVIDAKGDLVIGTADNTPGRQAIGADGQFLKADSTQATSGMKWANIAASDITGLEDAMSGKQAKFMTGTVATAAGTAAKAVTLSSPWSTATPAAGDIFLITFTSGNTVASPTLAINGTTARPIKSPNNQTNASNTAVTSGGIMLLYFDGTTYFLTGATQNTTYSEVSEAEIADPDSGQARLISGRRAEYLMANEAAKTRTLSGAKTFTGAVSMTSLAMGGNKITNVGDPTSAQEVATKNYVDNRSDPNSARALKYDGEDWPDRADDAIPTIFIGGTLAEPPTDADIKAGDLWITEGDDEPPVSALADLSDVSLDSPQDLHALMSVGGVWTNVDANELFAPREPAIPLIDIDEEEAAPGTHYMALTLGNPINITLPAQPPEGSRVRVTRYSGHDDVIVNAGDNDSFLISPTDTDTTLSNFIPRVGDTMLLYYLALPYGWDTGKWVIEQRINKAAPGCPKVSTVTPTSTTNNVDITGDIELVRFQNPTVSTMTMASVSDDDPLGTPHGRKLMFEFFRSAGGLTLTWSSSVFRNSGTVELPTTLAANKTYRVGLVWDSYVSRWICVAADPEGY
ncbi:hypothetical protein SEA_SCOOBYDOOBYDOO_106 [Mycobacterium phage ScoobyDoobyDoo]|nr:hypothetical protein SEA_SCOOBYDOOBYDOO_106 [Mycobacterium phage ScoobyDoobyDoo]